LRLRPTGNGPPLFCCQPASGSSVAYQALDHIVDTPLYGLVHRHLQSGLASDLEALIIGALADDWALTIQMECAQACMGTEFHLIGASFGGWLAIEIAIAAERHGVMTPRHIILLDPMPRIRRWQRLDVSWNAAASIMAVTNGDLDFELPLGIAEIDLLCLLASRRAKLGFNKPLTQTMLQETQRELHVTKHLLELAARPDVDNAGGLRTHRGQVVLIVVSHRAAFYTSTSGLSAEEASVAAVRQYGSVSLELVIDGEHHDECARCISGAVPEFNSVLRHVLRVVTHSKQLC
jgi:thioesterase domain-containing protein